MKVHICNIQYIQVKNQKKKILCSQEILGEMYVTRSLSMYKKFPSRLSLPPPEGPNSGILVIQDEKAEETCWFGLFKTHQVTNLPFPQNKNHVLQYSHDFFDAYFIPVLN